MSEATSPDLELPNTDRFRVATAWPGAITDSSGFVAIPMALLRMQSKLEISPTEFGVLINILAHRWKLDDVAYPRTTTIAKRMGITSRTVQRSTGRLEKLGLIKKVTTNKGLRAYDAAPLVDKLQHLMPEARKFKENESLGA